MSIAFSYVDYTNENYTVISIFGCHDWFIFLYVCLFPFVQSCFSDTYLLD